MATPSPTPSSHDPQHRCGEQDRGCEACGQHSRFHSQQQLSNERTEHHHRSSGDVTHSIRCKRQG